MRVAVVGGGSWGTAFARLLVDRGHDVALACRDPVQVQAIAATGRNPRYLPEVDLSSVRAIALPELPDSDLLALVRGGLSWRALRAQAPRTPSPNSGWPMAAMALALDVRLGKPGVYVLHEAGRAPQAADSARAVQLGERVVLLLALLLTVALLFVGENRA